MQAAAAGPMARSYFNTASTGILQPAALPTNTSCHTARSSKGDCIEATVMGCILLDPGRVARTHNKCPSNSVTRGKTAGGKRGAGQPAKQNQHFAIGYCPAFRVGAPSWTQIARRVPGYRVVEEEARKCTTHSTNTQVNATNTHYARELLAVSPMELPACPLKVAGT